MIAEEGVHAAPCALGLVLEPQDRVEEEAQSIVTPEKITHQDEMHPPAGPASCLVDEAASGQDGAERANVAVEIAYRDDALGDGLDVPLSGRGAIGRTGSAPPEQRGEE